jgi:hypothetical protein
LSPDRSTPTNTFALAASELVRSFEGVPVARRTGFGPARAKRNLPIVFTLETLEASQAGHLDFATFYADGHAVDQRLCNLLSGRRDDSPKRLSGHLHLLSGSFLVQAFHISKSQRFQLIDLEY